VQSSPGVFDTCVVETPAQCAAQGGIGQGSGSCSPNPCLLRCCQHATAGAPCDTGGVDAPAQGPAHAGVGHGSGTCCPNPCGSVIQCCVQTAPTGAFNVCVVEPPAQCAAQGGIGHGSGTCSPSPCLLGCVQPGTECAPCGTGGGCVCATAQSNTCGA